MFGFSIFNIKNACISTLVSSYRMAASFRTSKFLEHNTENEEFEKKPYVAKMPAHAHNSINNNNNNNNNNNKRINNISNWVGIVISKSRE